MSAPRHAPFFRKSVSVRSKIMASLIALSASIAILISVTSYNLAASKVKAISLQLSESNTATAVSELNARLDDVHTWSGRFASIKELQTLLADRTYPTDSSASLSATLQGRVMAMMAEASSAGPELEFVSIYLQNGYSHSSLSGYTLPFSDYDSCLRYFDLWETAANETYTNAAWALCWTELDGKDCSVLVYLRFLYQPVTLQKLGVTVFAVNEDWLAEAYMPFAEQACLVDPDGVLLSASGDRTRIGTVSQSSPAIRSFQSQRASSSVFRDEAGRERIVSYQQLSPMNAFLVVPFDLYEGINAKGMREFLLSAVAIVLGALVVTALLSYYISRRLTQQVSILTDFTKQVEHGQTNLRYEPSSSDEIAYLGNQINLMLDQLQSAAAQKEASLRENQQLELQLNQIQINPHLLYNTLDSVLWVLHQNRMEDATELLASLSEFFKISLSRGRDKIALSNELQLVQHYLNIQRLARQQDIQLRLEIEQPLFAYPILKLSIQPLVENAVVHGFAGYRDDGCIQIRAYETESGTQIDVTDNGIGLLPEETASINQILSLSTLPDDFHHFGLFNINRRIVQAYGPAYGIQIQSETGAYTTASIRLPRLNESERIESNV